MSAKDSTVDASRRALFRRIVPSLPEEEQPAEENSGPPEELVLGKDLMRQGKFDEAIEPLRTLVKSDANLVEPRRLLGVCLYLTGWHIQSRVEFERVLRIAKSDDLSSLYLCLSMLRKKVTRKATRALEAYSGEGGDKIVNLVAELRDKLAADDVDPIALADLADERIGEAYVAMLGLDEEDAETAQA